ncbi:MAG: hypothetical protein QOI98_1694 [Solirubrobacteraceae bacterium]|jgi:hypothetical protein|nr:hypothetical protein [Solirubrobacteraceae bacterium]
MPGLIRFPACLVAALLAAPAVAGAGSRADFAWRFDDTASARPTALRLHIRYKGLDGEEAKPSPIRRVSLRPPTGTGIAFATTPACEASDAELQVLGDAACPAETRVGRGTLTAITGFGAPVDPFATELSLFNLRNGILELVKHPTTGVVIAIERLVLEDGALVAYPAIAPGGPPDGASGVRDIDWTVDAPGYFTTPAVCPPDGWVAEGDFTFEDGVRVTERSATPCDAAAAAAPVRTAAPVRRLVVRPNRFAAGRTVRLAVHVPTTPRCRAGALVRIGTASVRTDARGRATVVVRGFSAGRHRATSERAGCAPRGAWMRVRR